jgi:hypothetical protein
MSNQRTLSEGERDLIRQRRRAELAQGQPGIKFFIYVADETDENGGPIVSFMREEDWDDPISTRVTDAPRT